jgi:vacuolar-type H+-ATPase subunit I/STV1
MIYQRLTDFTDRVCLALKEADPDPDVLCLLSEEQDALIEDFKKAGIPSDGHLTEQLQALNRRVSDVISEIQQFQQEISTRMKEVADGKKLARAYST